MPETLTRYQQGQIRAFAAERAKRLGAADPDKIAAKLLAWAGDKGYDRFNEIKAEVRKFEKIKRHRLRKRVSRNGKIVRAEKASGRRSANVVRMIDIERAFDLPVLDEHPPYAWFFYH